MAAHKPTVLRLYKSYNFTDKDPIIDQLRTLVQDSGMSYRDVHDASDVSISCMYQWFHGKTRRPTHAAIMAVIRACGYDLKMVRRARVIDMAERRKRA